MDLEEEQYAVARLGRQWRTGLLTDDEFVGDIVDLLSGWADEAVVELVAISMTPGDPAVAAFFDPLREAASRVSSQFVEQPDLARMLTSQTSGYIRWRLLWHAARCHALAAHGTSSPSDAREIIQQALDGTAKGIPPRAMTDRMYEEFALAADHHGLFDLVQKIHDVARDLPPGHANAVCKRILAAHNQPSEASRSADGSQV